MKRLSHLDKDEDPKDNIVWMKENKKIRTAAEDFLQQNPWAFEFDPRQKYQNIMIYH